MSVSLPHWDNEESNDFTPPSPRQVLRVAINLKQLIDTVVPFAQDVETIRSLNAYDGIDVVSAVYRAAGGEGSGPKSSARRYQACLVFCLLKVSEWFLELAEDELADNDLYMTRALVAQRLASVIIKRERCDKYLFLSILCHRYSINLNDTDSDPANVLELAIDMKVFCVITTSEFQRCIKWLWRGWIVQSKLDPSEYVLYKNTADDSFWTHFNPDRIQTPKYQNLLEIAFSVSYLALFTILVNTDVDDNCLNLVEAIFLLFTTGFTLDELVKFYHIGGNYIQFQNVFNLTIYGLVYVSFFFRVLGIFSLDQPQSELLQIRSYRFLSCCAPMVWIRMVFLFDLYQVIGIYIVIIKKMLKESILFFVMLSIVIVGFLQGFVGLDQADGKRDLTYFIVTNMLQALLSGPDFNSLERFAYPYGSIMYYAYNFLVSLMLMNILIALFSQAYSEVVEFANNYYLHQYASRVLRYIRAPDSKIFFPPMNLIEIFAIDMPLQWWMNKKTFENLKTSVMKVLYLIPLFLIADYESKTAMRVAYNRQHRFMDDANEENRGWDLTDGYIAGEDCEDHLQNIREGMSLQRAAEEEDPKFRTNFTNWNKQLANLAPPLKEARKLGVSLDDFDVISRLEAISKAIETLSEQYTKVAEQLERG